MKKKLSLEKTVEILSEIKVNNINSNDHAKSSVKRLKGLVPSTNKKVSLQDMKDAIEQEVSENY